MTENNLFKSARERVFDYYKAGFVAALKLIEEAGDVKIIKENADNILNGIFGAADELEGKGDESGAKSE